MTCGDIVLLKRCGFLSLYSVLCKSEQCYGSDHYTYFHPYLQWSWEQSITDSEQSEIGITSPPQIVPGKFMSYKMVTVNIRDGF